MSRVQIFIRVKLILIQQKNPGLPGLCIISFCSLGQYFLYFICSFLEFNCTVYIQSTVIDQFFCNICIGSLKTNNDRHINVSPIFL